MFVPKIDTCLTNLLTNHEDVEIGRCVILATGHACTWAFEMQTLFYHRAGGKDDKVSPFFDFFKAWVTFFLSKGMHINRLPKSTQEYCKIY